MASASCRCLLASSPRTPYIDLDCIIIGGGPAGLTAAVYLGRYLRPTLLLNHKKPQTRWHRPIAHNILGFPAGIHRNQLLDWGREHVAKYDSVTMESATVCTIRKENSSPDSPFQVTTDEGAVHSAKGLILAFGVEYTLPDIPHIFDYAGHSIWHCPECDGYKSIGKKIAVIGHDRGTVEMALNISIWTNDITLCANGADCHLDQESTEKLHAANIRIVQSKITKIHGLPEEGKLHAFECDDGARIDADGAFANSPSEIETDLLKQLPLNLDKGRWVVVDHRMRTNIPRCYAAGDIVSNIQTQLSVAMGTGATAAIWLHKELLPPHLCLSGRTW